MIARDQGWWLRFVVLRISAAVACVVASSCFPTSQESEDDATWHDHRVVVPKMAAPPSEPVVATSGNAQAPPAEQGQVREDGAHGTGTTREAVIEVARKCSAFRSANGLGLHGSPLLLSGIVIVSPSEARSRGERGSFHQLGNEFRSVHIPESPPFDQIMPNGLSLLINLETGACKTPRWRQ